MDQWHHVANVAEVASPALLIYPERVRKNIRRAIEITGDPARLRPHVKTHKMASVIAMHLEAGVKKFKCATIAEAEMTARAGASEILIATQLIGPNVQRFQKLREAFPATEFAAICDSVASATALNALKNKVHVYVDVDCGMHRTGIAPEEAAELARFVEQQPHLHLAGLHAYDGHVHDPELSRRTEECENAFVAVEKLRASLSTQKLIASGTPTFPIHARHHDRECSPGTYVFWDFGYQKFADLPFEIAALVLTRVLSKPAPNRLCLDLGHKAIAAENPQPRVQFPELPNAVPVMHSEEHLVLETPEAARYKVGDVLFGIPRHICPTVALYDECFPIIDGRAGAPWPVEARRRRITI